MPEACGDRITYSVEDFGAFFEQNSAKEIDSCIHAMRLYLNTLLFSLKIAIGVRDKLNAGRIPLPVPASGQVVKIGDTELGNILSFCASPIQDAKSIPNSKNTQWTISQGDLFRGKVNVYDILKEFNPRCVRFLTTTENTEAVEVVVKVSSKAVHNILSDPLKAHAAMQDLKQKGQPEMMKEIGSVLYAAVKMGAGVVTIMADLSQQGYKTLKPDIDDGSSLPAMWAGFADLVETVLLPMAAMAIIHPDIRPGYDVTFNILCKREEDDGGAMSRKASMKLIDYESLVDVDEWTVPMVNDELDGRFLPVMGKWDATTYVWWQCVFVAYVWKEKIAAGDVSKKIDESKGTVVAFLKLVLLLNKTIDAGWPGWLVELRRRAQGKIDASVVKNTLDDLGKLF
jgi:hypothetical protein